MGNNEFRKGSYWKNVSVIFFYDIIKLEDFDLDNILKDQNHIKIFWYITFHLFSPKPLRIRFDQIDGFIRIYEATRYLISLGPEKFDVSYNRLRYLISLKSGITCIFSHYYRKIKVDSYDSFPIEKKLTLHNAIILIKSVLNKSLIL